jgi:hypothetical protein
MTLFSTLDSVVVEDLLFNLEIFTYLGKISCGLNLEVLLKVEGISALDARKSYA